MENIKNEDVRYILVLSPSFLPQNPDKIEPKRGKKTIK
tara:strand:- start:59 stop:172 length:114 start_codon:yes stop_codon:yes gene_type:complete